MHNKAAIFATVLTTATLLSHSAWAFFGLVDSATTFREEQKPSVTPSFDDLPPGPPADLYYNTREGEAWSRYYTRTDLQAVPYMQGSASMVMRPNGEGGMGGFGPNGKNMAHYGPDGRPAIGPDGRPVQGYDALARRDMINKGRKKAEDGNIFIGEAGTYPPGLVEPGVWPGAERDLGVKARVGKPKQEWNPRPHEERVAPRPGDFDYGQQISSVGQTPTYDEGGNLPPYRQGYEGPADPYAARSPLPTNDDPNFGVSPDTLRNAQSLADTARDGAQTPRGATPQYGDSQNNRNPYDTSGIDGRGLAQGQTGAQGDQSGQGGNGAPSPYDNNRLGDGFQGQQPPAYGQGGQQGVPGYGDGSQGQGGTHGVTTPRGQDQNGIGGAVVPGGHPHDAGRNPDGTYDKGSYTEEALGYSDEAPQAFPTPDGARVNVPPRNFSSSGAASSTNYGNLPNTYIVQPGDSLSGISDQEQIYGDWKLWPLIYDANRDQIDDPDLIHPEQQLGIPRDTTAPQRDSARQRGEQKTAPYLFDDGQ